MASNPVTWKEPVWLNGHVMNTEIKRQHCREHKQCPYSLLVMLCMQDELVGQHITCTKGASAPGAVWTSIKASPTEGSLIHFSCLLLLGQQGELQLPLHVSCLFPFSPCLSSWTETVSHLSFCWESCSLILLPASLLSLPCWGGGGRRSWDFVAGKPCGLTF